MKKTALLCATAMLLQACSWMPFVGKKPEFEKGSIGEFIAKLPSVEVPDSAELEQPTREDVIAAYRDVYNALPGLPENQALGKRLADLEMEIGEEANLEGEEDPYRAAIDLYEQLLENSDPAGRDAVFYQLARAHDVVGEIDRAEYYLDQLLTHHPDSEFAAEAHFRRAEMRFSRAEYRGAASDYQYVVERGDATPYFLNSSYMLGWSHFKIGDLEKGLAQFFAVVQDAMAEHDAKGELERLPAAEQELVNDTLRVSVLALGYLDGAETLAAQMRSFGKPEWQHLVYAQLADDLLEKERYLDSVATLDTFVAENPLAARAPTFHLTMIDTLIQGGFPSDIREKQEEFIFRYGVRSEFWSLHDGDVRAAYLPTLKEYLGDLSKLAHSEAQASGVTADYLKAADWYEQMVATFPSDPSVAEFMFLLGEVYTEAGEHGRAVAAYQRVVREFPDFEAASEAGYAAILGLKQLVESSPLDEQELWTRLKVDAQIEFAMVFPDDPRAVASQADAANELFALEQYAEAVELAQHLVATRQNLDPDVRRTALLILGHGRFELADFVAAETAYRSLLAMSNLEDRNAIEERLLASIYKQAEAAEQSGNAELAVSHFLRMGDVVPGAALAVQGHFDAIAVMETAGMTMQAAGLLEDFRQLYPDHELAAEAPKRLAAMYESTGNRRSAAREYEQMAATDNDPEVRRQSLYRAAELQLEIENVDAATRLFSQYVDGYSEPKDLRLEALHQLDELAQQVGDEDRRRVWLREKIELHASMGAAATPRAAYLAADARYLFALEDKSAFEAIRLTHPLPESLKRKTAALKRSVGAFEAVAGYKVAEFSTAATFQIADMYGSLSTSIYESDRPKELSELELEQYDILLEEQAFPFEEQAISLHEINMRRSWDGVYDDWVKQSFDALSKLMPARFDKKELTVGYVDAIY